MSDAAPPADASEDDLPEQVRVRREKRQALIDAGTEPYPVVLPDRTHTIGALVEQWGGAGLEAGAETGEQVVVAGRVVFQRNTGKLCFARLREGDGSELQVMLSLAEVGEGSLEDFKRLVDIGDHLWVAGQVVMSRRGELSVMATQWRIAAKTLRPLPNEHRPMAEDTRATMRYVDLIVRPEARAQVRAKATVLRSLRETLHARDYVEVETPVLQSTNGGAAARPFRTHANAVDAEMLLRIALELDLKRALVGGVDRVYEIGKTFRNEGADNTHNPEFAMLEAYEAYGSYETMMALTRDLVLDAARAVGRTVVPARDGGEIDLEQPWRRARLFDLVSEALGEQVDQDTGADVLRRHAEARDVALRDGWGAGEIALEVYEKLVEHTLVQPTFVCDYPTAVRPLAKPHRTEAGLVEAFDLMINGVELAPAYSELNDPVVQRERLEEQSRLAAAGDPEAMDLDTDFLRALEFGMPPAGGMGMGVDRLTMLLTGVGIREAILFPFGRRE